MQIWQEVLIIHSYISGSKMERKIKTIFVITIIFLISLPIIFFNSNQEISEKENRKLAEKPLLIKENHLNMNIFEEYDYYLQDHFGFRNQLIQLDAKNPLKTKSSTVIGSIGRAIEGKNGWYFFTDSTNGNNFLDFHKRNLLNYKQVEQLSERIYKITEWCKEQNILFIFLIGPNKHSVYEEFYPYDRPEGITRADQITKIFDELKVPYIFPRDFLISKKTEYDIPFYYETDTHWNPLGAYLVSTLIREKIESFFPTKNFPKIEYETKIDYSMTFGDLLLILGIEKSKSTQPRLIPIGHDNADYYEYLKNEGVNYVNTKGSDKNLPRALIFRDSFFYALEPFISPLFSNAEYRGKPFSDEDKDYVLQYKPDIIIFESVERFAPNIVKIE